MNFIKAREHILKRLKDELPKNLYYHGLHHTVDVTNAVERLCDWENINHEESNLIKTAALYHDAGFIFQYEDNEPRGVELAKATLPGFGYSEKEINLIEKLILVTSIPHNPKNLLEKIICDADLDYLGRDDFFSISHSLKREWQEYGKTKTLHEWYELQLEFILQHKYFTEASVNLREERKQKHIEDIRDLLGKLKTEESVMKLPSQVRFLDAVTTDITIDKVKVLKSIDIFSTTADDLVNEIANSLKILKLKVGDQIIYKGEIGTCMFIIYEGSVKVHDGIYKIAELEGGKFFGEISLLDTEPRSADVTATTDCVLLQLDQEDFSVISHRYNDVARGIMRVLLGRLRNQNASIINELKTREKQLQELVDIRTKELKDANAKLGHAFKNIRDSINYAKRIQEAILPAKDVKYRLFPDAFVLYQPRDVVSGDFYWFTEVQKEKFEKSKLNKYHYSLIAAVDCTGHGVPGAFMSLVGLNQLNQIVNEKKITAPAEILHHLNNGIKKALKQDGIDSAKDGMDIALCTIDNNNKILEYSGAHRPLYYIRNNELKETKGNNIAIGGHTKEGYQFTNHQFNFEKGDTIYICSDGYADQFGGPEGRKLMTKQFKKLLLSIQEMPMMEQEKFLLDKINTWKGTLSQLDDLLVIGIRF